MTTTKKEKHIEINQNIHKLLYKELMLPHNQNKINNWLDTNQEKPLKLNFSIITIKKREV